MGQFGPRAGGESPQRAISPRQYLGGHREGVPPAGACSQENGQKLLRRQRAGTDGPKPLAGPVVLEVLGKTKRHAPRLGEEHGSDIPFSTRRGSYCSVNLVR